VVVALFSHRAFKPAAGLASSLTGFTAVTGVYALVNVLGAPDEAWGTVIWTVDVGGRSFGIWQEYALLFALPVSLAAFLLGQWLGKAHPGAVLGAPMGGEGHAPGRPAKSPQKKRGGPR
jgi:hypothetical protein